MGSCFLIERRVMLYYALMGLGKEARRYIKLAAAATILFGPPLANLENTGRILGLLSGRTAECLNGTEARYSQYQYDAIAIFGAGAGIKNSDGTYEPNPYQKSRIEAAAILYAQQKVAPNIIFLDGVLTPGEPPFASKEYFSRVYAAITGDSNPLPDEKFFTEHASRSTASNARELEGITEGNNIKTVLIVTNRFHENRAALLACAYGVTSKTESVETIFEANPQLAHLFSPIPDVNGKGTKEGIEILSQIYDPYGKIQIALK